MDSHRVVWRKVLSVGLATKNCHPKRRGWSRLNHLSDPEVGTLDGFGPVRRKTRIAALVNVLPSAVDNTRCTSAICAGSGDWSQNSVSKADSIVDVKLTRSFAIDDRLDQIDARA